MAIKNAKYRVQNAQGEFEIIHFETNMGQVQNLTETMEQKADREEFESSFQELDGKINQVEQAAQGLTPRVEGVESGSAKNKEDISLEKQRAIREEQSIQGDITLIKNSLKEDIGTELESLKAQAKKNESGISEEEARAKVREEAIDQSLADKVEQTTFDNTKGELKGLLGEKANLTDLDRAWQEFNTNLQSKASKEDVVSAIEENLEKANTYTDLEKGKVVSGVKDTLAEIDLRVGEIDSRADLNKNEIAQLKIAASNKSSNIQVYQNMEEFIQKASGLKPEKGDLVYIIEGKKAYIYSSVVVIVREGVQPPSGWELFDSISTEADLSAFIKSSEVESKFNEVQVKLDAEIDRATAREDQLDLEAKGVLGDIEQATEDRKAGVSGAERKLNEAGQRLIEKIDAGLPSFGKEQPSDKEENHIWIDMEI